jgi:hypothetical protein
VEREGRRNRDFGGKGEWLSKVSYSFGNGGGEEKRSEEEKNEFSKAPIGRIDLGLLSGCLD